MLLVATATNVVEGIGDGTAVSTVVTPAGAMNSIAV